jgi:hypothetical protein
MAGSSFLVEKAVFVTPADTDFGSLDAKISAELKTECALCEGDN